MLLGLDKTYKKEKKDRRFAQFNLILGAAADAGKREFNFTTREYKRRTRDQVSQRFLKQSRDCRRRRRLRSIFVALRPHGGHGGHLYLKKRERESTCVCVLQMRGRGEQKNTCRQTKKERFFVQGREKKRYPNSFLFTNLHCLH